MVSTKTTSVCSCAHCGEEITHTHIHFADNDFCCDGCKMVYQLLNQTGLCDYYQLNEKPGINKRQSIRKDKFAFLDDADIQQKLISFSNEQQIHVCFYLPQMHCSSCLYLLENLHKLNPAIISSSVNFTKREVSIIFTKKTTLRKVAELLTDIGYEPYISLNQLKNEQPQTQKSAIYQLGVAGFCFANIMLLSFPEYLGLNDFEHNLQTTFRYFNLLLSLPVLLYSAQVFYKSALKGLQHRFLNIDAPIVLAILVTFSRSVYEVTTGSGSGYFDSMTGIVFFMLIGRILQDKTYQQLSFERDYTSYFPVAVTVMRNNQEIPTSLPNIKLSDTLLIHNEELIPADGILTKGKALIDYSFVTGESMPILKEMGEIVYAGGRQKAGNIEVLVMKEVSQSYLTSLWEKDSLKQNEEKNKPSFVHLFSQYFTIFLLTLACSTALYWYLHDASKIWSAVTAILIIACPCTLLLSSTFTNGKVLQILGNNHFYLRSASAIEAIAQIDNIVFDKTGTLTSTNGQQIRYEGTPLSDSQKASIALLASQSNHPLNKMLTKHLSIKPIKTVSITGFQEHTGKGIEAFINNQLFSIGSSIYILRKHNEADVSTSLYVAQASEFLGRFIFENQYRENIAQLLHHLQPQYDLSIISGDNNGELNNLQKLAGKAATIHFNQKPENKLQFIESLQHQGKKVMMIGDGLNDAGALKVSNIGIAIAEDCNNFTPASDAIIEAKQLPKLLKFIQLCKANKRIIVFSFILSILYNIVGLSIAVQGSLSPLVAAILMPSSSLTILLATFGSTILKAKSLGLELNAVH